jgi:hypothetical protein
MRWLLIGSIALAIACAVEPAAPPATTVSRNVQDSLLAQAVRDASTAEEWFFADSNYYPADLSASPFAFTLPPGVTVEATVVERYGYVLVARTHEIPDRVCVFATSERGIEALLKAGIYPEFDGLGTTCMFPETVQCFDVTKG